MSTIKVENLTGLSSGANANKIIVPAGHTIDASAGTLVPSANQVVQHLFAVPTAATTFTTGSYTDAAGFSVTITPKYNNSKILIRAWAKAEQYNGGGGANNSAQDHRLLRDSTDIYTASWQNYFNQQSVPHDFYPPFIMNYIDTPSSTSAITYKIQGRIYAGTQRGWIINNGNGGATKALMEVLEIKQ